MSRQRKSMAMASILDACAGARRHDYPPGTILLSEGDTSGRLYVLAEGAVEVLRGDTQVAVIKGAGSIFGEMSVLLGRPHTATVRAASPALMCSKTRRAFSGRIPRSPFSSADCSRSGSMPPPPTSSTSSASSRAMAIISAWSARCSRP